MKRLSALPTGFASRICAMCSVVLMLTSAVALAQSTDAANSPPAPPSAPDEASTGCDPIGLTASGEVVFPFRCKGVIELQRAAATKPADPKPDAAAVASAVQQKPQQKLQAHPVAGSAKTAAHPASVAPTNAKPAPRSPKSADARSANAKSANARSADAKSGETEAAETEAVDTKSVETTKGTQQVAGAAHERGVGPSGCTQFQSYNAVTATYLGFDGQRHPCRAAVGQVARNQVAGNQAVRTQLSHKPSPADIKH
jgi:hypothetical protein